MTLEGLEKREVLSAAPDGLSQYAMELVNLARTHPPAAADWISNHIDANDSATLDHYGINLQQELNQIRSATPQPALAWNDQLGATSLGQSQDQANHNYQGHNGSNGSDLQQRLSALGYNSATSGEDAFAYANSVDHAIKAFLIDWGVADKGHRRNILQPGVRDAESYRDIGIGIVPTGTAANTANHVGPYVVTMDFGSRAGASAQLLGVAYNDSNHDGFYTPGEGKGGIEIDAVNIDTGEVAKTYTAPAGGYQMELKPGSYQVTDKLNGVPLSTQSVNIGGLNVKVDFNNIPDKAPSQSAQQATVAVIASKPVAAPPQVQPVSVAIQTKSTPTPTPTVPVAPAKPTLTAIRSADQLESFVNSWVAYRGTTKIN